jgi:hypothetical protein
MDQLEVGLASRLIFVLSLPYIDPVSGQEFAALP